MAQIGKRSRLVILRDSDSGQWLDGGRRLGEILLPNRYVDPEIEPGDEVDVFVYRDSEDRVTATTETPLAEVGDIAALVVKDVGRVGAFLDWGLPKDLLLPYSEHKGRIERGDRVVVQVVLDRVSDRIVATRKLRPSADAPFPDYRAGQKVDILVASRSPLGFTVIVEGRHLGLLFANDVFRHLEEGERTTAYVRRVRPEDGKIDLSLEPIGYGRIPALGKRILAALREGGGFLALHDKSSPEEIQNVLGCSKKNFKKAVGSLYREGLVKLEGGGVRLAASDAAPQPGGEAPSGKTDSRC